MSTENDNEKFSKKLAKEIAKTSFGYVVDCINGFSDTGYDLSTEVAEFEQNFEEDLEAKKIKPTPYKIKVISEYFTKMQTRFTKLIETRYKNL